MFSGNGTESKTTRMYGMFRRIRQVVAPGVKSAISDCILLLLDFILISFICYQLSRDILVITQLTTCSSCFSYLYFIVLFPLNGGLSTSS